MGREEGFDYPKAIMYELGIVRAEDGTCSMPQTYELDYARSHAAIQKWLERYSDAREAAVLTDAAKHFRARINCTYTPEQVARCLEDLRDGKFVYAKRTRSGRER